MFQLITAILFGSNLFNPGTEIEPGRWERAIVDCINERPFYWQGALEEAVKIGDVKGTEQLVKYCVKDPKDLEHLLFKIAKRTDFVRKVPIVKVLVDNGVNVNAREYNGETPLHAIAHIYGYDIAKFLIENGADVNAKTDYGSTPLHFACKFGTPALIKLLLENGSDVNAKNNEGETPLHVTSYFSDKDKLARAIIENANNTDLEAKNNDGKTPLETAIRWHSPKVAKLIIEHGANISGVDDNGNTLLHRVIDNYDIDDHSRLIIVRALIDHGMDVNARNNDGDTCLHLTRRFFVEKEVADLLVRNGADINIKNKNGTLPHNHLNENDLKMLTFFADLKIDQTEAARILIENGFDVNNIDNGQYIPIIYSAYNGNAAIARYLVEKGVDVNTKQGTSSPLTISTEKGDIDVVRTLVSMGADLDAMDDNKRTPLDIAKRLDEEEIVAILKEAKEKQQRKEH